MFSMFFVENMFLLNKTIEFQSVIVLPRGFISYLWCSKPVEVVRELYNEILSQTVIVLPRGFISYS